MKTVDFFLKHYGDHLPLSEEDRALPSYERANRCLSSSLPWLQLSEDGSQWVESPGKRHSSKGVPFVIITPSGYYSKYRIAGGKAKHLGWSYTRLIADWDYMEGKERPAKLGITALGDYLSKRKGNEPFLLITMNDKNLDSGKLKTTYDLRYVVVNHPVEPMIFNLSTKEV